MNSDYQYGNYIALHVEVPGVEDVELRVTSNLAGAPSLELFEEGDDASPGINCVIRVPNKNSQTITVVASKEGYESVSQQFMLYGLATEYVNGYRIIWEDTYYIAYTSGARSHRDELSNSGFIPIPSGIEDILIIGSSTINGSGYCFYTTTNYSYPISGSGGSLKNADQTLMQVAINNVPDGAEYVAFSTKTTDVADSRILFHGIDPPGNEVLDLK